MPGSIAIIGAGSWGTALAIVLAPRFERIRLWAYETDLVERMAATRVNDVFLPGFSLARQTSSRPPIWRSRWMAPRSCWA